MLISGNPSTPSTGVLIAELVIVLIVLAVTIVACWKLYKKMGEPGWKSIVPIYNEYVMYQKVWSTKIFWITLVLSLAASVCGQFVDPANPNMVLFAVVMVLAVILLVFTVICLYKLGKSFGHGAGFLILAILFPCIAVWYLGFNKDKYLGNTTK